MRKRWLISLILVLSTCGLLVASEVKDSTIKQTLPKVVEVECAFDLLDPYTFYYGSAVSVGDKFYLSAKHLYLDEDGNMPDLISFNGLGIAEVVDYGETDEYYDDWALLKSTYFAPSATLCFTFENGDSVFKVGNDAALGVVSADGHIGTEDNGIWSLTMSVRGGCSGGGLFNKDGELLGITTCMLDNSFGFFIPLRDEMFEGTKTDECKIEDDKST